MRTNHKRYKYILAVANSNDMRIYRHHGMCQPANDVQRLREWLIGDTSCTVCICQRSGIVLGLYSTSTGFESQPTHWLSWSFSGLFSQFEHVWIVPMTFTTVLYSSLYLISPSSYLTLHNLAFDKNTQQLQVIVFLFVMFCTVLDSSL
jgi:hypothetical protein